MKYILIRGVRSLVAVAPFLAVPVIGTISGVSAQNDVANLKLDGTLLALIDAPGLLELLPIITFTIVFVILLIFIFYVLAKSLNPFTEDQEGKFKEGKTWFTQGGLLMIAPIILVIVIVIILGLIGLKNPFTLNIREYLIFLDPSAIL